MIKWINKKRNQNGFTLVELVVVIAILGILAALAIPRLGGSRVNAAVSAHNANVRTIESAATMYLSNNPASSLNIGALTTGNDRLLNSLPDIPKALLGKTTTGTNGTGVTIAANATYTVTVDTNNEIVVSPGLIDGEAPYSQN